MIFDRAYRQRLDADLREWEAGGVITPASAASIRLALPPLGAGINISTIIAIVGGLLIAAGFLAFVAAHWTELARLFRFAMLVAGLACANGLGYWFTRTGKPVLADLCVAVGAVIFGAGIALVGQMYHLGEDFAAGMLLWSLGALVAAALSGSRGALAVALAAAVIWTSTRAIESLGMPHFPFILLWLAATGLAFAWKSRPSYHLTAITAVIWWTATIVQLDGGRWNVFIFVEGAALLFGAGLAMAVTPWRRAIDMGEVFAAYGAVALAASSVLLVLVNHPDTEISIITARQPFWAVTAGISGALLAFAAAARARRPGAVLAAGAVAFALAGGMSWLWLVSGQPWIAYALQLVAMLCLVISGQLDANRPQLIAGWLGLAGIVAAITWVVDGSLLRRSIFFAIAGVLAVMLSGALNRLLPRPGK